MAPAWSTYRVQLHREFPFADLTAIADYLAALGVTHAYCSPSLQAVAGSTHGYDVVDPHRVNLELGGIVGFASLAERLRSLGLGTVLDIVPNHMALDGPDNRWWWDVLANGPSSRYAHYFDIDWDSPERKLMGNVLVPILGDHYGRILEAGELHVAREGSSFVVRYHDHVLPLSPRSINDLLAAAASQVPSEELASIAAELGNLPHALVVDADLSRERARGARIQLERLRRLMETRPEVVDAIERELKAINDDPDALDDLLRRQNYRLAFWRTASDELDYRRFFNIESLVGLRVEDPAVFDDTHSLISALVEGRLVNGLRVDHVDGLLDPPGYLERLADASAGSWVAVEKILAPDEALPEEWPVAGTTGYEFLNRVNGLFVSSASMPALTALYATFVDPSAGSAAAPVGPSAGTGVVGGGGGPAVGGAGPVGEADGVGVGALGPSYAEIVWESKMQIMREELRTEVERLTSLWALVAEEHRRHRDYTRRELRDGLREALAAFPVYRTYVRPGSPLRDADRQVIQTAVAAATERRPDLDPQLFAFLGELLQLEYEGPLETELALRFQQLSSPVMAKGVEDTAFYRYNRLVSLNEVGGSPDVVDGAVARFHRHNRAMAAQWPRTMLTLATHDTKRGPDTRARINVLSEIPGQWAAAVAGWAAHNAVHRSPAGPDRNAEYLLYQTLVGAWPIEADRVVAYMEKATKEAKVHTTWSTPNADYDAAVRDFVTAILSDDWFVDDMARFLAAEKVVEAGRVNSLAQAALLLTCPGYADLYQGTELWDHSLVDPDNRRPVNYDMRRRLLTSLSGVAGGAGGEAGGAGSGGAAGAGSGGAAGAGSGGATAGNAGVGGAPAVGDDGAAKLWLVHRLLQDRRDRPDAYGPASGYEELVVEGPDGDHVVAFWRTGGVVTVVPRLVARFLPDSGEVRLAGVDAAVRLPAGEWAPVLAGGETRSGSVPVADLWAGFPAAVLRGGAQ